MAEDNQESATSRRWTRLKRLAASFASKGFRHSYMARQLKLFLAEQIRALRGDLTQKQFGDKIGKPQSVVSRIEKQLDKGISIRTLIDIAEKLDIAVIIRFVDFPTFLKYTDDYSDAALVPGPYEEAAINALVRQGEISRRRYRVRQPQIQRPAQLQLPLMEIQPGLQQPQPPILQNVNPIRSADIILLRPLQQRIDERNVANVGQPQRLAS